MLVNGVRTFTDSAHAIECRNANSSREVPIRSAAHGRFFQIPVNVLRDRVCLPVESGHASRALHGHTVDAAFDRKLAMLVMDFQRAQLSVKNYSLLPLLDAYINIDLRLRGDDVCSRTSPNDSRIR